MMCGGLGDRIGGITSLFFLALDTCRRFRIIWDNPADITAAFQSGHYPVFNLTKSDIFSAHEWTEQYFSQNKFIREKEYKHWTERVMSISHNGYYQNQFPLEQGLSDETKEIWKAIPGHFRRGCIWRYLFRPRAVIKTEVDRVYEQFNVWKSSNSLTNTIGIHMRTGSSRDALRDNVPFSTVQKCANIYCRKWYGSSSSCALLVMSDDKSYKDEAKLSHPNQVFITDFEPTHMDKLSLRDKRNQTEIMIQTFTELILLSKAQGLIHSHSGFSENAGEIGFIPAERKVLVKHCEETT